MQRTSDRVRGVKCRAFRNGSKETDEYEIGVWFFNRPCGVPWSREDYEKASVTPSAGGRQSQVARKWQTAICRVGAMRIWGHRSLQETTALADKSEVVATHFLFFFNLSFSRFWYSRSRDKSTSWLFGHCPLLCCPQYPWF